MSTSSQFVPPDIAHVYGVEPPDIITYVQDILGEPVPDFMQPVLKALVKGDAVVMSRNCGKVYAQEQLMRYVEYVRKYNE